MLLTTQLFLTKFGFTEYEVMLSTRPDKSVGTDEIWDKATNALTQALGQIAQNCERAPDVICLQEVEFSKEGDKRVPPAWLTEALQGYEIIACKASILERNAKRNLRVVGKDVAVATAIAVGRGWSVAWTGEHNGTTEVLVGVEKDGVGAVAVASVHLDAGSEDKRVQLLGATLAAARARLGGGRNLRVIVAGDMNAEFKVGSALGAVVSLEDGDAADARRECTVALRRAPDDAEIVERCTLLFANEAAHCLSEKIIREPMHGDIGAIFGLGFLPFTGGPFRYIDTMGVALFVDRLNALAEKHGPRFEPAPILKTMAKATSESHRRFYP